MMLGCWRCWYYIAASFKYMYFFVDPTSMSTSSGLWRCGLDVVYCSLLVAVVLEVERRMVVQ